jgi:hypothetical protein
MKYVKCRYRGIFLFSPKIRHEQMRDWLGGEIVSAGLVALGPDGLPMCSGHSSTLGISADERDTEILREQMALCLNFEGAKDAQRLNYFEQEGDPPANRNQ